MVTGKNYIGTTLSAESTKTYKTFNPIKNTPNETIFFEATSKEIEKSSIISK